MNHLIRYLFSFRYGTVAQLGDIIVNNLKDLIV